MVCDKKTKTPLGKSQSTVHNSAISKCHFFLQYPSITSIFSKDRSGLLREEKAKAFLHSHPMSGELVVWGEPSRVGRAGWLTIRSDFLLMMSKEKQKSVAVEESHQQNWEKVML